MKNDGLLVTNLAGTMLRLELDRIPLWKGDHVAVKDLTDWFAQYLYLPRLRGSDVLIESIRDGVKAITWAQDSFAYADRFDAAAAEDRRFVLVIPPEGTRRARAYWKSGFYEIARAADVPVVCIYLDYERRVGGFGPTVEVAVARVDLAPGTAVGPETGELRPWPADLLPMGALRSLPLDLVVAQPVLAGEPLVARRLDPAGLLADGSRALALPTGPGGAPTAAGVAADALNALLALGYSDKEAVPAIKQLPEDLSLEESIRQALKLLAKK
jgi:hypothetical protein